MYIGRFAPTPSGDLHFGSIVTAIASYLDAKKVKGHWLLKIDDIDKQRVKNNSVLSILKTLESLNLFWDSTESYQSNRLDEYRFYFEKLSATHQTYNCSCSRKYLSDHAKLGNDGYIYPGFCKYKELENKFNYKSLELDFILYVASTINKKSNIEENCSYMSKEIKAPVSAISSFDLVALARKYRGFEYQDKIREIFSKNGVINEADLN